MFIVEFVGGPYDAHQQPCLMNPSQLPRDVTWFVCEDGLRLIGDYWVFTPLRSMFRVQTQTKTIASHSTGHVYASLEHFSI